MRNHKTIEIDAAEFAAFLKEFDDYRASLKDRPWSDSIKRLLELQSEMLASIRLNTPSTLGEADNAKHHRHRRRQAF